MTHALRLISRRRAVRGLAACALAPLMARAQAWPAKPIKITVAYPPGGVADAMARLLADKLAPVLGQSVLVDNKAGASGSIGMDAVAKAAPDGYSFGFSAISPLVLNPHLGKSPFDAANDIAPVASVIASPVLLLGTHSTRTMARMERLGSLASAYRRRERLLALPDKQGRSLCQYVALRLQAPVPSAQSNQFLALNGRQHIFARQWLA